MLPRSLIVLGLMISLCLPAAVAQQAETPVISGGPEQGEVPRDPYIPVLRDTQPTSPAYSHFDADGGTFTVQVNVDASFKNIVGDAANEPSLTVDPTNPNRMAIGWRQFDTVNSDFRQAGWAWSDDGGLTWHFPGVIEPGIFRSDPVLDSDADGVFYYNSLTNSPNYQCKVFRSFDGGQTWDAGVFAQGGDKQWQVIDTTSGIGRGNIYASWNRSYSVCNGHFTRSINGGDSFENCSDIPGTPYWGVLAVGPNGELYCSGQGFMVAKSTTAQDPNQVPVQWDFMRNVNLGGSIGFSGGPNPGGLLGQAWVVADPTSNNVYLLCSVDPGGSDPMDVTFARSTDGGQTWSAPVRVNDDVPGTDAWQWFGTMDVAPNGRIDAVWLDTRNDPGGYNSQLYYSFSDDGGQTWAENRSLSASFDPHVGWPQQNKMGDYFDMTSLNNGVCLAWAGTLNGEQDVYYSFITRGLTVSLPSGVPSMVPPGVPTEIDVRINPGEENLIAGSEKVHYRYDGGNFVEANLTPLGNQLYRATLPAAQCDDTPEFYFSAQGDESGLVTVPPDAPNSVFSLLVGEIVTLWSDNFETDKGWFAENLGATSGDWERGVPVNDPGWQYDPISDSDGSGQCYLTENAAGNTDVDGGAVRLTSPTIDMSAGDVIIAYDYYLFLSNTNGVDRILVEINTQGGQGAWTEIARHTSSGGTSWRTHQVTEAELNGQNIFLTNQVKLRFTTNDGDPQSINESGLDAVRITQFVCDEPFEVGDLNCDGKVDFGDINPFVMALSDPVGYAQQYPDCDIKLGDINQDGKVDFGDINPFVALLTQP